MFMQCNTEDIAMKEVGAYEYINRSDTFGNIV